MKNTKVELSKIQWTGPKEENALLRITSIHEAGHALVYHSLGAEIEYMQANETGDGIVSCRIFTPTTICSATPSFSIGKELDKYGMVCLSGYCAELKHLNKRLNGNMHISNATPSDNNDISRFRDEMKMANQFIGEDKYGDFFFYLVQSSTRKYIASKKCWQAILSLSDELIARPNNYLEGCEIHDLLDGHIEFGSLSKNKFGY